MLRENQAVQSEQPKRRLWPSRTQEILEFALLATVLLAYGVVAYLNFFEGRVRGPFSISRYYQLGDFEQFPPVDGRFDLNRTMDNFDVEILRESRGQIIPGDGKNITVVPRPADNSD